MSKLGKKAGGATYEKFMATLALKESSGNPSAIQWDTKAVGLFQFIPRWHASWIKETTGQELNSFLPRDSSPEEMQRAVKEQTETLFPAYYERELAPFVGKMRSQGLGKSYTDPELAAMAHFAGPAWARTYLSTGVDKTMGTAGNAAGGIATYIREFSKTYAGTPEAQFKAKTESASHYGEHGLGRGVYTSYADRDLAKTASQSERAKALRGMYAGSTPAAEASPTTPVAPEAQTAEKKSLKSSPLPDLSSPESSPEPLSPPLTRTSASSPKRSTSQGLWAWMQKMMQRIWPG